MFSFPFLQSASARPQYSALQLLCLRKAVLTCTGRNTSHDTMLLFTVQILSVRSACREHPVVCSVVTLSLSPSFLSLSLSLSLPPHSTPRRKVHCKRSLKWTSKTSHILYASPIIRVTLKRVKRTISEKHKNLPITIFVSI
jgi:hypothetical protein